MAFEFRILLTSISSAFGGNNQKKMQSQKNRAKKKGENKNLSSASQYQLRNVKIYGFSKQGQGPKKTENQDSYCIMNEEQFKEIGSNNCCYFFAVYDGHGSSGKEASQSANDFISNYLIMNQRKILTYETDKQREALLASAFKFAENKLKNSGIDYSNSGTCAITIFIYKGMCYISNLGDSRAILYRRTKKEQQAIELSWDHKPTRQSEAERILRKGGKIYKIQQKGKPIGPKRVWADEEGPGIAMTRTLGDLQAKKIGLISDPEIQHLQLQYDQQQGSNWKQDYFIVIGSDGIWDVMHSAEVCGFVAKHENKERCVEDLVKECEQRWEEQNRQKKSNTKMGIGDLPESKSGRDDITCIIAYLNFA